MLVLVTNRDYANDLHFKVIRSICQFFKYSSKSYKSVREWRSWKGNGIFERGKKASGVQN